MSEPKSDHANCRILVVLDPYQDASRLLHNAKRKAESNKCDWEVLVIETAATRRMSDGLKEWFAAQVTLAEEMGATVTNIIARNMLEGVTEAVHMRESQGIDIIAIKIGFQRSKKNRFSPVRQFSGQLKKALGGKYRITYIPSSKGDSRDYYWLRDIFKVNFQNILKSLVAVLLATALIEVIDYVWPQAILEGKYYNKVIIYMTACAYAAVRFGLLPGVTAAVASFVTIGTIYIAPYNRLIIDDVNDAASLGLFLIATIFISLLGSREYGEREAVIRRVNRLQSLMHMNYNTLNERTPRDAVKALDAEISKMLGSEVAFFMPDAMQPDKLRPLFKGELKLSAADQEALELCWQESKTTGVGSPHNPGCLWRFEPLQATKDQIGVLAILLSKSTIVDVSFGKLLSGIADQATLILERVELGHLAEESRVQAEREKLRAMLLSSVSHDLKTPLASVIGSLSVFRSMRSRLPEDKQETLINTALDEAHRLDSFITNILDMTRIESGQVDLKQEWIDPNLVVKRVRKRLKDRLINHPVAVVPSPEVMVLADQMTMEQVLQNLLDNAAKYTQSGTHIEIGWKADDNGFALHVRDYGDGIPAEKLDSVFDKYERINKQDSQVAGTGLGLAIAKAVMQAQDGDITAHNHPDGGAVFTIKLPKWQKLDDQKKEVA